MEDFQKEYLKKSDNISKIGQNSKELEKNVLMAMKFMSKIMAFLLFALSYFALRNVSNLRGLAWYQIIALVYVIYYLGGAFTHRSAIDNSYEDLKWTQNLSKK